MYMAIDLCRHNCRQFAYFSVGLLTNSLLMDSERPYLMPLALRTFTYLRAFLKCSE